MPNTAALVISSMQDAITSLTGWVDHEHHRLDDATVTTDVFLGDNE